MPETITFYLFAALAVGASVLVIAQRNPMYSVLLLIASFGALSGLYIQLDAPFVAVAQIIIYAGAIMVLFLFVQLASALMSVREYHNPVGAQSDATSVSSVADLGRSIFTRHTFAFEATSILILVAMVGAVVLARREDAQ